MTTTRLGLFVLGFLAATGIEAVRADEAYLCEGGRVVKVPFGKLDEMKRTDACIAGYYGLKVETPAARLETGTITPAEAPSSASPAAQSAVTAAVGPRPGTSAPAANATAKKVVRRAAAETLVPVRAAAGTDYRNVVLLNPEPGQPAMFRHER